MWQTFRPRDCKDFAIPEILRYNRNIEDYQGRKYCWKWHKVFFRSVFQRPGNKKVSLTISWRTFSYPRLCFIIGPANTTEPFSSSSSSFSTTPEFDICFCFYERLPKRSEKVRGGPPPPPNRTTYFLNLDKNASTHLSLIIFAPSPWIAPLPGVFLFTPLITAAMFGYTIHEKYLVYQKPAAYYWKPF